MLIDARALPSGQIKKDICIIGAGPAGISLAREFIGQRLEVALLESGGFEPDAKIQTLAGGRVHGDIKAPIEVNRRQFGGNSNVWSVAIGPNDIGVRHAIFDESDFVQRDWVAHSGWPFGRDHLLPYYERAQVVCHAGPFAYAPEAWESPQVQRLPLQGTDLETGIFQFGPANVFYRHYRNELIATKNIALCTYASAVELVTDESGQAVTRVRVARPGGPDVWVSAKVFILATGGFENARLLLMSNRQQAAGLGNQHDVVGRYYHDHLQGRSGYLTPADPQLFNRAALYDLRQVKGAAGMAYLKLSQAALQREGLLNINCFLYPKPGLRQNQAIESFNFLRDKAARARPKNEVAAVFPKMGRSRHLMNTLCGIDYVARMAYRAKTGQQATAYGLGKGGWSALHDPSRRFDRFEVWHSIEQAPHPDNRVTLGQARDMCGCPQLELHWHWPQADIDQTLRAQAMIAHELERAGLGRLQLMHDPAGLPNIVRPVGSHHLMGTTRMHDDARKGVVDADCRVHGMGNLFIAGSSTFPAGGYANPTLIIVAMALRLADLLKQELAAETLSSPVSQRVIQEMPASTTRA